MAQARYRVELPDLDFYRRGVACQQACPVHTDARAYVNAIAKGEYELAYLIARETNPFASTCGWVCGAPCEAACRRGTIDAPIAIRALKRYVNDRYGVYLGEEAEPRQPPAWRGYGGQPRGLDLGNSALPAARATLRGVARRHDPAEARVAVVGAGPAGLTCAHDLALIGYDVTIFEASPFAGGMLRLGVPEYRLPRELIDLEIEAILALGPKLELGKSLGTDLTLGDLRQAFDAVFLAIGTYRSRQLNIEGEEQDGVLRAVDFLLNVNLGGYNLDLGRSVLVIGGGNVAMDVARTAARLGHPTESGGDVELALDVARAARRLGSTQEVHCLVVEAREEMLADSLEVAEAETEGVRIQNHVAPMRILGEGGRATSVQTLDVGRAFDDQGRFNPELIQGTERNWSCDSVIVAIGQMGELSWLTPEDGLHTTPRGTLQVNPTTLETSVPGIFTGGDIAFGPRLIVHAVADGQRAAAGIHRYLSGAASISRRRGYFTPIDRRRYSAWGPLDGYLRASRQQPPSLPVARRVGVASVEEGYDEAIARKQAARCLICSLNPIFDSSLCILCNGCVDVCPEDCLKLVPASDLEGDFKIEALISTPEREYAMAMLLDPARCIRCGLCAARCPTEAVVMNAFRFTEEVVDKESE